MQISWVTETSALNRTKLMELFEILLVILFMLPSFGMSLAVAYRLGYQSGSRKTFDLMLKQRYGTRVE